MNTQRWKNECGKNEKNFENDRGTKGEEKMQNRTLFRRERRLQELRKTPFRSIGRKGCTVSAEMFDSEGMLILPEGAAAEFREKSRKCIHNKKTGIYATCPSCGYTWERWSLKAGNIRCYMCKSMVRVGKVENEIGGE